MTGKEIVEKARTFKKQKYWYGAKNQLATVELANVLRRNNPGVWTDAYYNKAVAMIKRNQYVSDCSGMVCAAYQISHIGSSQLRDRMTVVEKADAKPGMMAWRQGHIGIIIDDQLHIAEMRSIDIGYDESRTFDSGSFVSVLKKDDVDYEWEYAKGWHMDKKGWWYAFGTKKGSYLKNGIYLIDDNAYWFGPDGYTLTGVVEDGKGRYAFDESGGLLVTGEDLSLRKANKEEAVKGGWQIITT